MMFRQLLSLLVLTKEGEGSFYRVSAVCRGATEPKHWYAADTTTQRATSLPLSPQAGQLQHLSHH